MTSTSPHHSGAAILHELAELLQANAPNHGYQRVNELRNHYTDNQPAVQEAVQEALLHYSGYWAYLTEHYVEAIEWFTQSTQTISPYDDESMYYWGLSYFQQGQYAKAIETFNTALMHHSTRHSEQDTPEEISYTGNVHGMLGLVHNTCGHNDLAQQHLTLATQQCPSNVIFWQNLGAYHDRMYQFNQAQEAFTNALKLDPSNTLSLQSLARVHAQLDHWNTSQEFYAQLLQQAPSLHTYLEAATQLPYIYPSTKHINQHRTHYASQLLDLLEQDIQIPAPQARTDLDQLYQSPIFALPYQGHNDRDLIEALGQLLTHWVQADTSAPLVIETTKQETLPQTTPIRLGIISRYLKPKYTVGKLYLNVLKHLPAEQFDLVIIHIETAFNPQEHSIWQKEGHIKTGHLPSNQTDTALQLLKQAQLDIAFYPDAMTDAASYLMAIHRVAPIQCTSWGHPVTSGLPNMDYYISSHLIEPENAQDHYTEQLVLMDNLPVMYHPPTCPQDKKNSTRTFLREQCGLDASARVYYCPQSLFKIHPDFDSILSDLLLQDTDGHVVLIDDINPNAAHRLLTRFKTGMPKAILNRIHLMPRCTPEDFLISLAEANILLDPIHFGGGNTTFEALSVGTPIVTWPSELMRGRITQGCYHAIDNATLIKHLIADSPTDYITKAIAIATDDTLRAQLSDEIKRDSSVLWNNPSVAEEFTTLFTLLAQRHTGPVNQHTS